MCFLGDVSVLGVCLVVVLGSFEGGGKFFVRNIWFSKGYCRVFGRIDWRVVCCFSRVVCAEAL